MPAADLAAFVSDLAHRIARFPAEGYAAVKARVNAIALAAPDEFRRDSDLFGQGVQQPAVQARIQAAGRAGFQTRAGEMDLGELLGRVAE